MSILYEVSLSLSPSEVAHAYNGSAKTVMARLTDGRSIEFPVRVLRSLVDQQGVNGIFILEVEDGKFIKAYRR